mgnify:CR=1 FL=1
MRMVDIIAKKRDGLVLSKDEIHFLIQGYTNGSIPDYQMSALAMAIVLKGMNKEETAYLTEAMMHSGETIDLSLIKGVKVDKHSTGGVGDKTSLALGPLVASCGAKLAKMSGRGLGHTGGTLDKMESVPGMSISLTDKQFIDQVNRIGIAIIGQTADIDPADKKLYALRDVTATVQSIPLIASSIMSKKLASGADAILLDVKFGSGAFMKTIDQARELATCMVEIGDSLGRDTRAILTDMDEPLGLAVGNALEVKEAIATLKGHGPKDFVELVVGAGAIMLEQAHIASSFEDGGKKILEAIENGKGFEKQKELFQAQGGDISYLDHPEKFPVSKIITPIFASRDGYVKRIDSLSIGISAMKLGAGRETLSDTIDMSIVNTVFICISGCELLATAYTNKNGVDDIYSDIHNAFVYSDTPLKVRPIIHEYIHK